jgi:hypothetical protein
VPAINAVLEEGHCPPFTLASSGKSHLRELIGMLFELLVGTLVARWNPSARGRRPQARQGCSSTLLLDCDVGRAGGREFESRRCRSLLAALGNLAQGVKIIAKASPRARFLIVSSPWATTRRYGTVLAKIPGGRAHLQGDGPCDLFNTGGKKVQAHWT